MAREFENILINRLHDRQLKSFVEKYLSGRLVDIGCGTKPFEKMTKPFVTEHVGVDHEGSLHDQSRVDLIGSAYAIPAPDGAFDSALCTAVLEHLEEPGAAIQECSRVLRGGGIAIYSVPFIWHIHEEPRDFYRFTHYGLTHLFNKAGFDIVEMKALSGFWVTFGQFFIYNMYRFHRGPMRYIPIIPAIGLVIQAVSYALDRVDKTEQWTWMYMLVARKR